jgi:F0F1-type ATP synthase alpha subunit
LEFLRKERSELLAKLREEKKFAAEIEEELKKAIVEFKKEFVS